MKKAAVSPLPLTARLLDWWQGTDRRTFVNPQPMEFTANLPEKEDDGRFPWTAPRVSLNHRIWGPGFVGPGGGDYTLELVRPAAVDSSQSLLDFNSGLGGPAAIISKSYQMYVDGQEQEEVLVDEGVKVAKHYHVSERVKILDYKMEEMNLPEKKYFCVLSREHFYTIDDKTTLVQQIYNSLKENGSLVFTDFIVKEKIEASSLGFRAWAESEPTMIFPWKPSQYRKLLSDVGFELRIFGDETDKYRQMVMTALSTFAATLEENPIAEEQTEILARETDIWQGRIKALESGDVKILRVHAVRKRKLF